jgi:CIC family chloride channel protein
MRQRGAEDSASDTAAWALVEQGVRIEQGATLERAMPMFGNGKLPFLPVVELHLDGRPPTLIGALFYVDALRAFNRALVEVHEEEHG